MRIDNEEKANELHHQACMMEALLQQAKAEGLIGLELEILEAETQKAKEADVEFTLENLLDDNGDKMYVTIIIEGVKRYKLASELTKEDRIKMFESWTA